MWDLGETLRRDRPLAPLIADLRRGIREFLRCADLSESVLIMDGPGVGLSTPMIALALLGMERIHAFREVYCMSGSNYQYLCLLAKEQGYLRLTQETASQINESIQRQHGTGTRALARILTSSLQRPRSYPFDGGIARFVVESFASAEFCQRKVSLLPDNLRIWSHCDTDKEVVTIHSQHPTLRDMTTLDAIHAATAVPRLYSPALFRGRAYSDGFWARDIGQRVRQVRESARWALALHMRHHGIRDNVHYLKVHRDPSDSVRVGVDYLYFLLGLTNWEFSEAFRLALFEIDPV